MHISFSFRVHTPIHGESLFISFTVLRICLSIWYGSTLVICPHHDIFALAYQCIMMVFYMHIHLDNQ